MRKQLLSLLVVLPTIAYPQSAMEKLEAATQYVDNLALPGKSGLDALRKLNSEGFKTCSYVGGALTTLPPDEPAFFCAHQDKTKLGCSKTFQVIAQMEWGGRKLTVPEMLKEMQVVSVKKVTTLCL